MTGGTAVGSGPQGSGGAARAKRSRGSARAIVTAKETGLTRGANASARDAASAGCGGARGPAVRWGRMGGGEEEAGPLLSGREVGLGGSGRQLG